MINEEFNSFQKLLRKDRSVRRFAEEKRISPDILKKLVELTRFCASGRNLQPLKYRPVFSLEECEKVFPLLQWAGYLADWDGPEKGERPSAYLVQCLDTGLTKNCLCDEGLQLQAITLGATSMGLGGCIIKAFNSQKLTDVLNIPERYVPSYVYALGYPLEVVEIVDIPGDDADDIKYFRTTDGIHHVPKRNLESLIIQNTLDCKSNFAINK